MSYIKLMNGSWLNKDHVVTAKIDSPVPSKYTVFVTTSQGTLQKVQEFELREEAQFLLESIIMPEIFCTDTDTGDPVPVEVVEEEPPFECDDDRPPLVWKRDGTGQHVAKFGPREFRIKRLKTRKYCLKSDKELMSPGDTKRRFNTLSLAKQFCEGKVPF